MCNFELESLRLRDLQPSEKVAGACLGDPCVSREKGRHSLKIFAVNACGVPFMYFLPNEFARTKAWRAAVCSTESSAGCLKQ